MPLGTHPTKFVVQKRRQLVASLALRNLSQREIVEFLGKEMQNEDAGKPYTVGTVNRDLRILAQEWRKTAAQDLYELKGRELAKLEELEKSAWGAKDYQLVLKITERRSRLCGLDAPLRLQPVSPDESDTRYDGLNHEERASRIVTLLDRARSERARRTLGQLPATDDSGGSTSEPEIIFDGKLDDTGTD